MALINVAINFVYEYFSFVSHFSKFFFIKTCFQNFFCQNCFPKFFFQNFFAKLFYFIFFSKFFFSKLFFKIEGFTLDAFLFAETQRTLCICVMKNMIYRPI